MQRIKAASCDFVPELGEIEEERVSRVLFQAIISLSSEELAEPAFSGSRLSASASSLVTAGSEIAAGRIALFSRHRRTGAGWFLLLSHCEQCANLDCRRVAAPPWLSPGTLTLCSSDFPLIPGGTSDRPSLRLTDFWTRQINLSIVNVQRPHSTVIAKRKSRIGQQTVYTIYPLIDGRFGGMEARNPAT